MIKGLYAAASAMLAGVNRQQLLAHNVANMETPGFKQILSSLEDFMETSVVSPSSLAGLPRGQYVGNLGLGVESAPEATDFAQGGIKQTGHLMDFAIQGAGFFQVRTPDGERFTRDGRFQRDAEGNLATVDGFLVLNPDGQPIDLPEGDLSASPDGTLMVAGETVGQIGLFAFADPVAELSRDGDNTFIAQGTPTGEDLGRIEQSALEMGNANPTHLMTQLVEVARSYQAAQQMVQNQDELLGKTIASLGRIG